MVWFRGIVQAAQDTAKGVRLLKAVGRGVRELEAVPLMQQRGFVSVPVEGDAVLILQAGDLAVAVASGSTDKPTAESGETIVYSGKDCFVRILPDGTVRIKAKKIILGSDSAIENPLNGVVTRSCLCSFTGGPHPDGSSVAFAEKTST